LIKFRNNNKPEARLSVLSVKLKNRINTFNDSQYRPQSLKNIEEIVREKDFDDSEYSLDDGQTSKKSTEINDILKAMEKYLNKHIVKKDSWTNNQIKN
jgi:uncharacterized protein YdaT